MVATVKTKNETIDLLQDGEVQDPLQPSFRFFFFSQLHILYHHPLPGCGVIFIVGLPSSEMRKGYGLAH